MTSKPKPVPESHEPVLQQNSRMYRERTPEQIQRDLEFFNDHKRQVWSDMQAGSDEFDRGLLTISGGALALSLAFIKDAVPLARAVHLPLLFASWISFAGCIMITLASFRFSIVAQQKHLEFARRFHVDGETAAAAERHWCANALTWCTYIGGIALLVGFTLTIWFAITNINAEDKRRMKNDEQHEQVLLVRDGRSPMTPILTQTAEERGRQPIPLTSGEALEKGRYPVAPVVTTPPQTGTQTGTPGQGGNNSSEPKGGLKK